ncbi:uncharacterized protein E5676_scaffold95G00140 [Cucumis melo var. makuwa]|uniref:Uncharacterized protein n=1 Tax=Cucumis melo var. makuwa TaxID=1194695 RepID=A0A5A7TEY5_CUCMM|nr:uncharacterized protein E6C27_scaffold67G00870 [Cucumis melo var. makuwa]TYK27033.1 uncharacterized protein E5676_scaffold95G00140 [Cucumis melo var. makuwa]
MEATKVKIQKIITEKKVEKQGLFMASMAKALTHIKVSPLNLLNLVFVYDDLYWTRDCPNRKAMNVLVAKLQETRQGVDMQESQIGSLQLLGALERENAVNKNGLLYASV